MTQVEFTKVNFYEDWLKSEGIPIVDGFHVEDVNEVQLSSWPRKEGLGAYVILDGGGGITDAYVCQIPPGKSLSPQRHMFQEVIYILKGTGATSVWNEENQKQTFEWGPGSLFAIPLNAWHQQFNGSGSDPVRYLGVTNAPRMMNIFRNLDFIFGNSFAFKDRFFGEEDYWTSHGTVGRIGKRNIWETNFIPDLTSLKVPARPDRGPVGRQGFVMAHSDLAIQLAEHPVGSYPKAHRHGSGAQILTLAGSGYTLLWVEGQEKVRLDWKPGTLFSPPDRWFHQHFNTSNVSELSLRVAQSSPRYAPTEMEGWDKANVSTREGGDQIEYEDEEPEIRQMYEAELAKSGIKSTMPALAGHHPYT